MSLMFTLKHSYFNEFQLMVKKNKSCLLDTPFG